MRADAENFVERIDAALGLVKMSLDWDRALRRLDEKVPIALVERDQLLDGAPLALEDHAVRACYAALAMQEAV